MATYRTDPHLAKPTPAHALTPEAEVARATVRDLPPQRVVRDGGVVALTRKPLMRAEVVAAYVHPEPEMLGTAVADGLLENTVTPRALGFALVARGELGAQVKVTVARGTTMPKWHAPADAPVDPADYHGDVVDSVVVWARRSPIVQRDLSIRRDMIRVRAEWHDGRIHSVTVNGVKSSLRDALEALQ